MANLTKVCNGCCKSFEATTEFFHRNKSQKDGLLGRCKACQNQKTAEYRKGMGKDYWYDENGTDGWFREPKNKTKWLEYLKENFRARFNNKIYAIINPEGMVYVGKTKFPSINRRLTNHKNDYNQYKRGNKKTRIPLLWDSVDRYGWNKHTAILLEEMDTKDEMAGLKRESFYIEQYMKKGISLNKRIR
jgi:hypothetical protein